MRFFFPIPRIVSSVYGLHYRDRGGEPCWAPEPEMSGGWNPVDVSEHSPEKTLLDVEDKLLPLVNRSIVLLNLAGYEVHSLIFRVGEAICPDYLLEIDLSNLSYVNHSRPEAGGSAAIPQNAVVAVEFGLIPRFAGRDARLHYAIPLELNLPDVMVSQSSLALASLGPVDWLTVYVEQPPSSTFHLMPPTMVEAVSLLEPSIRGSDNAAGLEQALVDLMRPHWRPDDPVDPAALADPHGLMHMFFPFKYSTLEDSPDLSALPFDGQDNWGWVIPYWLRYDHRKIPKFEALHKILYHVAAAYRNPGDRDAEFDLMMEAFTQEAQLQLGQTAPQNIAALIKTIRDQGHTEPPPTAIEDIKMICADLITLMSEGDDSIEYWLDQTIVDMMTGSPAHKEYIESAKAELDADREQRLWHQREIVSQWLRGLYKLTWAELLMCLHDMRVIDILSDIRVRDDANIEFLARPYTGYFQAADGTTLQLNAGGEFVSGYMQIRTPRRVREDLNIFLTYPPVGDERLYRATNQPALEPTTHPAPDVFNEFQPYYLEYAFASTGGSPPRFAAPLGTYENDPEAEQSVWNPDKPDMFSQVAITSLTASGSPLVIHLELADGRSWDFTREREAPHSPDDAFLNIADETLRNLMRSSTRYPLNKDERHALLEVVARLADYAIRRPDLPTGSVTTSLNTANLDVLNAMFREFCRLMSYFVIFDFETVEPDDEPVLPWDTLLVPSFGDIHVERSGPQYEYVRWLLRAICQTAALDADRTLYVGISQALAFARDEDDGFTDADWLIQTLLGLHADEIIPFDDLELSADLPPDQQYVYEWCMLSSNFMGDIEIVGGNAGVAILRIRTKAYPDPARPPEIFDAVYSVVLTGGTLLPIGPSSPVGWAGLYSDWIEISASEPWTAWDFSGLGWIAGILSWNALVVAAGTYCETEWICFMETVLDLPPVKWITGPTPTSSVGIGGLAVGVDIASLTQLAISPPLPFVSAYDDAPFTLPEFTSTAFSTQFSDNTVTAFAVDSAILTPEGETLLRRFVAHFRVALENPQTALEIVGYASRTASQEHNQYLSEERAQAVYDFIFCLLGPSFLVPTQQSVVRGLGERAAEWAGVEDDVEDPDWRKVEIKLNSVLALRVYGERIQ